MTKVQSPEIGTALRTSLSLDAAGGMPLEFDQTIIPVAVVADVRELLTNKYIAVSQASEELAAVGENSYAALSWDSGTATRAKRLLLDAVTISTSVATALFMGFVPGGYPGNLLGLPRRKLGSLQSSAVTGRVVSDTSVNAPAVEIPNLVGAFRISSATPLRVVFNEPIILDGESQAFVVGTSTANLIMHTFWEWREERS